MLKKSQNKEGRWVQINILSKMLNNLNCLKIILQKSEIIQYHILRDKKHARPRVLYFRMDDFRKRAQVQLGKIVDFRCATARQSFYFFFT